MKFKLLITAILSISFFNICSAQMGQDFVSIGYNYTAPNSTTSLNDISLQSFDFSISSPKKKKLESNAISHGFLYSMTQIGYNEELSLGSELSNFHRVAYNIRFSTKLSENWRLTLSAGPSISSNFDSGIEFEDFRLSGMALVSRYLNQNKTLKLNFGLQYSTLLGDSRLFPMLALIWKPNDKWQIDLGFPRFSINYKLSKSTSIGTGMMRSGGNFSLAKDINTEIYGMNLNTDNITVSNMGVGFFFKQKINKHIKLSLNPGYTFRRELNYKYGDETVYEFEPENDFTMNLKLSIGI